MAGAGISVDEPSGIPAAWPLSRILLKWVAPHPHKRKKLLKRMTPGSDFNPYHFLRFEAFIQAVSEIDANFFAYLESTQEFGGPNLNHRLLARLSGDGATILTTNFDTRIEQAARGEYLSTFVLSSRRRAPRSTDRLIKVHGSFPWNRGRNATPRATLSQIGKLGLGFELFTDFQEWFRSVTTDRHLVVIGYSASDSFDVVPLIENWSNAKTVTWFTYRPSQQRHTLRTICSQHSSEPFPIQRNVDFAGHTLQHLANHSSPSTVIQRVYGSSISSVLSRIAGLKVKDSLAFDNSSNAKRNLNRLCETLSANPLTSGQRRIILRIIHEGLFGESYAEDVEAKAVRRGKKIVFVERKARFARGTAERLAHSAMQRGDLDVAFRILEESASNTADADQILLLVHHFEFRFGERDRDVKRLDRVIRKVERVSQRSGLLWGLIMSEWMKSFRLDMEWRTIPAAKPVANELSALVLEHTARAVYYGVRAGWQQWFATSARLAAKHATALRDYEQAETLLVNLLNWFDRETVIGIEEIAGTACALNTLGIRSGRTRLSRKGQQILSRLDVRICPVVKLLRLAARAEFAHSKHQWNRVSELQRSATECMLKVDPADHWGVKKGFDYLEHSRPPTRRIVRA